MDIRFNMYAVMDNGDKVLVGFLHSNKSDPLPAEDVGNYRDACDVLEIYVEEIFAPCSAKASHVDRLAYKTFRGEILIRSKIQYFTIIEETE